MNCLTPTPTAWARMGRTRATARTPMALRLNVCVLAISVALPIAESAGREPPAALREFQRSTLLRRFDRDRDAKLDEREKRALRDSFDGIDVPMLPDKPFEYTTVELPAHANRAELDRADNTPKDNPTTNAGVTLGRVLFYDTNLSRNNTISCASCHLQRAGFSDPKTFSVGFAGGHTTRNAMSLSNLRYSNVDGGRPGFFWDERAATLEAQVLMPIQDPVEMGMNLRDLEWKLQQLPYVPPLFEAAFGSREVTRDRIAKSVAQSLRSMVSLNSKFDRAAKPDGSGDYSADFEGFTAAENLGKFVFLNGPDGIAEHGCANCHTPPTFAMNKSLNNGLELNYKDRGIGALNRPTNDPFTPSNDGKFKASSLRNIALTAPYMHDGRFATLEQVIDHYSTGVVPHPNLGLAFADQDSGAPKSGLKFTAEQKTALIAFLKTLTDEQFVSDPKFSDPFVRLSGQEK